MRAIRFSAVAFRCVVVSWGVTSPFTDSAAAQTILYVDQDAPPGGDGFSWESAYNDLAEPLELVVFNIVIRVAEGTYTPDRGSGDRNATFRLKTGVTVEGGYAGISEPDPDVRDIALYETVLSGDLNGDDGPNFTSRGDNSYHVVTGSDTNATAVLDGFTVIGGNADGASGSNPIGGGMFISSGSPTIRGCSFRSNKATGNGGGVRTSAGNPLFTDCSFIENASLSFGGGVHGDPASLTLDGCLFEGNSARSGGGVYAREAVASRCVFLKNAATETGGAVYTTFEFKVNGCYFVGNSASTTGGAINQGGGVISVTNSVFNRNTAGQQGGACFRSINIGTFVHCTFFANAASTGRAIGGNSTTLRNCVLWDGGNELVGAIATYSNVQFGWPGVGNIFALPRFVDPDGPDNIAGNLDDDLRLMPGSPCIDAGDNTAVPADSFDVDGDGDTVERVPFDIDGARRFVNDPDAIDSGVSDPPAYASVVDMGAYEFQVTCKGFGDDCDGDGLPDDADNCPDVHNPEQADYDDDGTGDDCDDDADDDGVLNDADGCDFTPLGAPIQPNGTLLTDADGDCDVDLHDFAVFQQERTGPG